MNKRKIAVPKEQAQAPHICLIDIGYKHGKNPDVFWTWEGWVDEDHIILSDDIRDCVRFLSKHRKLLPKKIKNNATGE